jgi:hypothetical protein
MDHYSYLVDRQHRFLLIGVVWLAMAVVFTLAGECWLPYGRRVFRAEEPKQFWLSIAMHYLGAIFFIVVYLFNILN